MSHLDLAKIKPTREFFKKLQKLYPASWHHHEVRVRGRDNQEYKIFIPEGRPDMIAVVGPRVHEVFHDIEEACEFLRKELGLVLLPPECEQ